MNERVIIVGASGRIGRMVSSVWRQDQLLNTPILLQSRRSEATTDAASINWDPLKGTGPLCDWVDRFCPLSAMVVLAGVTPGPGSDLDLNQTLAEACLRAASDAGIERVLLASSSAVYGVGSDAPLVETALCKPTSAYGLAKLKMEQACQPWRARGIDLCILRIGNVAGADALLLNVAKSEGGQAIEIDIFDDGRGPVRSYIGVQTLASVLHALCVHPDPLPEILNIGTPEPISMDALADASRHPWRKRSCSTSTSQSIILDCSLLSSIYGFDELDSRADDMVRQWKQAL